MSKHIIKSDFTAKQMLSMVDVAGASITLALVSISSSPVLSALADDVDQGNADQIINKVLTDQYNSIMNALNLAAEGLQGLKIIRKDLIKTVDAEEAEKRDPLPVLDEAGLAKLFADIQFFSGE